MKSIFTIAALLALVVSSTVNAASLHVVMNGPTNSIFLEGGPDNGLFNTVKLEATPNPPAAFGSLSSGLNAGVPRPAGDPFTYLNRQLNADPLDGGLGWSLLGTSTSANMLGFSGGPLGFNISTADQPGGRLFLGNVQFTSPNGTGIAKVQLSNAAGQVVADLTAPLGIPEPGAFALAGVGMLGLSGLRRRS